MNEPTEEWTVQVVANLVFVNAPNRCVAITHNNSCEPSKQSLEDARFIAAAPDLFAACQAFLLLFRDSDMRPEDSCHEVAAIIQKAVNKAQPPGPLDVSWLE